MALLTPDVEEKVKEYLQALQQPVALEFYPRQGNSGSDMVTELWSEIAVLSPKLSVHTHSGGVTPVHPESADDLESAVTGVTVAGQATGIRFLGVPGGHEFGAFLETLVAVSTAKEPSIGSEVAGYLKDLQDPLHLYVFVTPT
ncbi:MAG: hypothetical protein M0Z53_06325 [Thermaerobacter sp.]|nr:hypothetical protein [Thermaerobacter sp.]